MKFKVYRDGDVLRLRKVVIELMDESGCLIDRRRMFGGLMFTVRAHGKMRRMVRLAKKMRGLSLTVVK